MEAETGPAFVAKYARLFDEAGIPYLIVGAFAVMVHGMPRFSSDLDIVVQMPFERRGEVRGLLEGADVVEFEDRVDEMWGRRLAGRAPEGLVLEVFFVPHTVVHDREFERAVETTVAGESVRFISPEDLVLRKLVNTRLRRSTDYDDALSVVVRNWDTFDRDYVRENCAPHRVCPLFDRLLADARADLEG